MSESKGSPKVPVLEGVRLEIDGEFRSFAFRFDLLAQHLIAKDERRLGSDYDQFMSIGILVKHYLWPRDHGLTIDQIMTGISYEQGLYITDRVQELLRLNNMEISADPTEGLRVVPPKTSQTKSSTNKRGNSKRQLGSVSGLPPKSSGTPRLLN